MPMFIVGVTTVTSTANIADCYLWLSGEEGASQPKRADYSLSSNYVSISVNCGFDHAGWIDSICCVICMSWYSL